MTNYATTAAMNAAQSSLSTDVGAMRMFEVNKKEVCVGYALWFFLGYFGAHNFYLEHTGVAVVQLLLLELAINFFWHLADAFLIPGWVRRENSDLAWKLGTAPR
jgi:TM2 domain-containing membrane protein YozV